MAGSLHSVDPTAVIGGFEMNRPKIVDLAMLHALTTSFAESRTNGSRSTSGGAVAPEARRDLRRRFAPSSAAASGGQPTEPQLSC